MNRRRAWIALLAALAMMMTLLAGCGSTDSAGGEPAAPESDTVRIVTTIFPEYDWVQNIVGENAEGVEVIQLLDNGVDLHSYQPTAEDLANLSSCDLFVYVGGESDRWVEDALKESVNPDMVIINLLEVLGDSAKEEEIVEGMEEDGEEEEGPEYDEHVWLSLNNAHVLVQAISEGIQSVDPDHAAVYEENTQAYLEKLEALDLEYRDAVNQASVNTLLFGDRFPFRYLTDDYGLEYYAAFSGCSAETEASFETVSFLAGKVDELGLKTVMTIDGSDQRIAQTIVSSTKDKDAVIRVMDSMQTTTTKDAAAGKTYLSAMTENLAVLKEALR
ncbi:MAG: zinc ABC transporter substrate-binding protein [Firmicutes bacterium]|nr:zinc ABC transporter substrate-binding protein [Bacillota bacterium]